MLNKLDVARARMWTTHNEAKMSKNVYSRDGADISLVSVPHNWSENCRNSIILDSDLNLIMFLTL